MEIIFAKTEYHYPPYDDFWRLVELAGFPTCYVKDIDLGREAIYITTPVNGELRPHVSYRRSILDGAQRCKLIHWNLERPDSGVWPPAGNNSSNMLGDIMGFVDHVWVSDRYFASFDPRITYVPMGSDPRLREGAPLERIYDIAALSYNTPRRDAVYGSLGSSFKMAPNSAWGSERSRILNASKCMLYVHQTPLPIGAPLRFVIAAAYELPLISETLNDPFPMVPEYDFIMAAHGELGNKVAPSLARKDIWDIGRNLHHRLCVEHSFRKSVLEGIERTLAI